jgi:hypothetical protein
MTGGYVDAVGARGQLSKLAGELGKRSGELAQTERDLEPVKAEYRQFIANYHIGLWKRSQDEKDFKLPSEALRDMLAEKEMDPALLGSYIGLSSRRDRLRQRIADLKAEIDAQRSILSALKTEMEATG